MQSMLDIFLKLIHLFKGHMTKFIKFQQVLTGINVNKVRICYSLLSLATQSRAGHLAVYLIQSPTNFIFLSLFFSLGKSQYISARIVPPKDGAPQVLKNKIKSGGWVFDGQEIYFRECTVNCLLSRSIREGIFN